MHAVPRPVELRLLLPLAILVPLGLAVTRIAQTGRLEAGPMGPPLGARGLLAAPRAGRGAGGGIQAAVPLADVQVPADGRCSSAIR